MPDAATVDAGTLDATQGADAACVAAPPRPMAVDCTPGSAACPAISLTGDTVATSANFHGFADPAITHDPTVPGRLWLAYSYLDGMPAQNAAGATVFVAAVATHLARSDDRGGSWTQVGVLWPTRALRDPDGSGEMGYLASETPSLAVASVGGQVTWYAPPWMAGWCCLQPHRGDRPLPATGAGPWT